MMNLFLIFPAVILALLSLAAFLASAWLKARKQLRIIQTMLQEKTGRAEQAFQSAQEKADLAKWALQSAEELTATNEALKLRVSFFEQRFADVLEIDEEAANLRREVGTHKLEIQTLQQAYQDKKQIYDHLIGEISIFDERLAFAEMGVYEPHFDFTDSETYKAFNISVREEQKRMITAEKAVVCDKNWMVDGSSSKGQIMTKRNIRLTLRAFNNECEAAIANARWNNVKAMEKRIVRARGQIDKHNASNSIFITNDFLTLKIRELYLAHEYREKLKAERDERADAARLAREEQRLQQDMDEAQEEEGRYSRLLAKATAEAAGVAGPQLDRFSEQIRVLERDLAESRAKFERAKAMAERTRSGYVYIISNIGSFGKDIVKIGLTRRLDPIDRVRELGDASVPFIFDTHAIIYSEDAPTLERALHNEFEPTRVNAQNYRKEFFRASLDDVEAALKRIAPNAAFFKDIEAQEYHETLSRRRVALERGFELEGTSFPAAL